MKVIARDNYDRDTVNDILISGPGLGEQEARELADQKNAGVGDLSPWFYEAVADDYKMKVWEP